MGKNIVLTWRNPSGATIVEECLLVSEIDSAYIDGEEGVIEVKNFIPTLMNLGMVVFEDEIGLFCLPPEQVINIEEV